MPGVVLFDDFADPFQNTAEEHQRCDHAERKVGHGGPLGGRRPDACSWVIVRQRKLSGFGGPVLRKCRAQSAGSLLV